jgi:rubrerythrin
MAKLKPIKKTTFLEAVAAAIQHEKDMFGFYERNAESMPSGPIKDLYYELAADVDEHIQMISELYSQVNDGKALPNLKMVSSVHKFHSTSINMLMRRLDRNKHKDADGDEQEALMLAYKEHDEAAEFYHKVADKFKDLNPDIYHLFEKLAGFQEENRMLLESYATYTAQGSKADKPDYYWDEEN